MARPTSPTEIADDITTRIREGQWAPGDPLPTYTQLASDYQVSRTTIHMVIILLKDRGVVTSRPGRAVFVAEHLDL
jgi:DNA-binding GntR family transcriptional regulator